MILSQRLWLGYLSRHRNLDFILWRYGIVVVWWTVERNLKNFWTKLNHSKEERLYLRIWRILRYVTISLYFTESNFYYSLNTALFYSFLFLINSAGPSQLILDQLKYFLSNIPIYYMLRFSFKFSSKSFKYIFVFSMRDTIPAPFFLFYLIIRKYSFRKRVIELVIMKFVAAFCFFMYLCYKYTPMHAFVLLSLPLPYPWYHITSTLFFIFLELNEHFPCLSFIGIPN